ncbi:hypothetical protein [Pseudomonas paralcaligenes]|uniref:hypothetical protein n=1 Tax=Pseudomonas paralcaligenes TaxID=2772558 RepID=UPI001C8094CC|nr:hypothetical protein [Pseudomonas paralcaligenes]
MKHSWMLACTFLCLSSIGPVLADGSALAGMGAIKCTDYAKYRQTPNEMLETNIISWIQGYLSGQNMERAQRVPPDQMATAQYFLPGPDMVLPRLDKYCADMPQAPIWLGAVEWDLELEQALDPSVRAPVWKQN